MIKINPVKERQKMFDHFWRLFTFDCSTVSERDRVIASAREKGWQPWTIDNPDPSPETPFGGVMVQLLAGPDGIIPKDCTCTRCAAFRPR